MIFKEHFKLVNFKLGDEFIFYGKFHVRLIKVTPKGYNFLLLEKNECFYQRHFYRSKYFRSEDKSFVSIFIPKSLQIEKIFNKQAI